MRQICCVLALAALVGGCSYGPTSLLNEASNAASQTICSGTFVSGLAPDEAYRAALRPEPGMWAIDWALHYEVDRTHHEVRSTIAGAFASRSVFLQGRGCTLIHDGTLLLSIQTRPPAPTLLPEIAGPAVVVSPNAALRAAIDTTFEEPGEAVPRATQAVVVAHDGRVIGERYAPGIGIDTALDGHSLAKSVVNALIGVLVREGRLDVHAQTKAPEWGAQDARAQITLDNLMRMDAGFDFDEGRGAGTATHMWYTQDDIAHFAAKLPLVSPIGQRWHYSSGSYAILSRLLRHVVGGPQELDDFAHREIFDPLGMQHVTIEFDGAGDMMGAHAVYASARDWARFGLLYLRDGVLGRDLNGDLDGRRILPQGWVRYSTTPTLGGGYGAGFWLNGTNAPVPSWGFPWGLPGAPADAFIGRGYMGQWIVIVPSENLVVVRIGFSHGGAGEMTSVAQLVRDVVRALHGAT
jgi:CubicO group peptidase (beta-lactamase class C family)